MTRVSARSMVLLCAGYTHPGIFDSDNIGIRMKTLADCLAETGMNVEELVRVSGLDLKEVKAIVSGNYTPSPVQRRLLAAAVGVSKDEIGWEHAVEVQHLWGRGPQFGRTPESVGKNNLIPIGKPPAQPGRLVEV